MNQIEQTLTTLDISEMLEMRHSDVLAKLEGNKKIKGIIPTLTKRKIPLSDFFIESTYEDETGRENKCYKVTKMGCDFLANKFNGEKGIVFTALYVKRFHEMEEKLKAQQTPQKPKWIDEPAPWEIATSAPQWPTPPERIWYNGNKPKINQICKEMNISHRTLFHRILTELGNWYDIKDRKELYKATYGIYPRYNMDLLDEFEDMEEVAENYLEFLENSLQNYRPR